jgi:hypothetical protein
LLRRIPQDHINKQELQDQLRNHSFGFKGEQSLDYFYRYLAKNDIYFLHSIRILQDDYFFQMDTLLITSNFLTILEIKYLAGHLYFEDRFSQLIRTYENKREAFLNPIEQVKRQSYHLSQILKMYKFDFIPIESLVVMTHPSAIIEACPTYKEAFEKVIKSHGLQQKFHDLSNKHTKSIFNQKQIKKLSKLLTKLSIPYDTDVCELFNINKNELLSGVLCPNCTYSVMKYKWGTWSCLMCQESSKTAHIEALQDYAYLISDKITNRECKQFLHLDSSDQTNHLLRSLNLPISGSTKSRVYHIDKLLHDK